jgi:hypothetical protein
MTAGTTNSHIKAMRRVMEYCVATSTRGKTLKPDQKWNGDPEFEMEILGRSDLERQKRILRRLTM